MFIEMAIEVVQIVDHDHENGHQQKKKKSQRQKHEILLPLGHGKGDLHCWGQSHGMCILVNFHQDTIHRPVVESPIRAKTVVRELPGRR